MGDYHQLALDYLLGELEEQEHEMFSRHTSLDPTAMAALKAAQEDLAILGKMAPPAQPNNDLRNRILDLCQPRLTRHGYSFLEQLSQELKASPSPGQRYSGGGAMVDLGDIRSDPHRDFLLRTYETFLALWPHVSGASPAAAGDLRELCNALGKLSPQFPRKEELSSDSKLAKASNEQPTRSLHYAYLATLPALGYFTHRIRAGDADVQDARRFYYLCRDQLKIMRSAFADLDPSRLQDDKKTRIHNTDLLLRKWRGARHSWFSGGRQIGVGHYFDGPVQTCRTEFAEYISNVYCLANMLAAKSGDKNYRIDLLQGVLSNASLTIISSTNPASNHGQISELFPEKPLTAELQTEEHYLANLVAASVSRAANLPGDRDSLHSGHLGCKHENGRTIIYFAWPELACG